MENNRIVISHTQVEAFERCHRYYSYLYREHLANDVGVPAKFSVGLIHRPLAALYTNGKVAPDWTALWDRYVAENGLAVLSNEPYTLDVAKSAFEQYAERYYALDVETFNIRPAETMGFWREMLAIPELGGVEVLYLSKPDVVFLGRHDQYSKVIPVDFKSFRAGRNASLKAKTLTSPLNRQLVGQAMAVGAESFMVNLFCLDAAKGGKPKLDISRHVVALPPEIRAEWAQETLQTARAMLECDRQQTWPKMAPSACMAYGELCQFWALCHAGDKRHDIIADLLKSNRKEESRHADEK